ncbi:MAG: ferredoxin [Saprospiraceae bacterium]|nr:ferredoxin [Saprospiraceae bacterium]
MIQIIQQRAKCIGCNACVEIAEHRWRVSRKDGKCTLVGAKEKRGFYVVNVEEGEREDVIAAARVCPARIIKWKDCS